MHVRFSSVIGLEIMEESTQELLGFLSGVLINPDTGKIEGFSIVRHGIFSIETVFLAATDISRFGTKVYVQYASALCDPEDIIRLAPIFEDKRSVLGQKIQTDTGVTLGVCRDIQFNTDTFMCEWLFPRKWFSWKQALPLSSVIEITQNAIVVQYQIQGKQRKLQARTKTEQPLGVPDIAAMSKE